MLQHSNKTLKANLIATLRVKAGSGSFLFSIIQHFFFFLYRLLRAPYSPSSSTYLAQCSDGASSPVGQQPQCKDRQKDRNTIYFVHSLRNSTWTYYIFSFSNCKCRSLSFGLYPGCGGTAQATLPLSLSLSLSCISTRHPILQRPRFFPPR